MDLWGLDGQVLTGTDDVESWPGVHAAARPRPTTRSTRCSRRSSSAARRRSGAAPPRSSATSWASGCSACPASRRRPATGTRDRAGLTGAAPRRRGLRRGAEPAPRGVVAGAGAGPWPVAVLLHGGYWRDRYDLHLMDGLAPTSLRGWLAVNVEYRRVGADGGGWPATFDDVRAAVAAAARLPGGDPRSVWWRSATRQAATSPSGPQLRNPGWPPWSRLRRSATSTRRRAAGLSDHAVHGLLGGRRPSTRIATRPPTRCCTYRSAARRWSCTATPT